MSCVNVMNSKDRSLFIPLDKTLLSDVTKFETVLAFTSEV